MTCSVLRTVPCFHASGDLCGSETQPDSGPVADPAAAGHPPGGRRQERDQLHPPVRPQLPVVWADRLVQQIRVHTNCRWVRCSVPVSQNYSQFLELYKTSELKLHNNHSSPLKWIGNRFFGLISNFCGRLVKRESSSPRWHKTEDETVYRPND